MNDGGMQIGLREEGLSEAFVRAIASAAGYTLTKPYPDCEGIDLTISKPACNNPNAEHENPKIDIQLKATYQNIDYGDYLKYQLPINNYRTLSRTQVWVPRLLVLLYLPREQNQWISHNYHESLSLHNCCYYLSLRGSREVNNTRSVQVKIPKNNIFSIDSLNKMMRNLEMEGHI